MMSFFLSFLTFVLSFSFLVVAEQVVIALQMHMAMPISIPKGHESLTLIFHNSFSNIFNVMRSNSKNNAKNSQYDNNNILDKNVVKPVNTGSQFNYAGKFKHYPPANKEWFNSVYCYNNNISKVLPSIDKTLSGLIKSYFHAYSRKLEKKVKKPKSRTYRVRKARLSTNRILVSRAELKHTNDKVIITVYVYNTEKKYYLNKLKKIPTLDQLGKSLLKAWTIEQQLNFIRSKVNKYIYQGWIAPFAMLCKQEVGDISEHASDNPSLDKFKSLIPNNATAEQIYSVFSWKFREGLFLSEFPKPLSLDAILDKIGNNNVETALKMLNAERDYRKVFIDLIGPYANNYIIVKLSKKVKNLNLKIQSQENHLYAYVKNNGLRINKNNFITKSKAYEENYMQVFVYKLLRREIISVYFKQLIKFNKLKFENRYVSLLVDEIKKIYSKKVEFNFVNLKYLHLSGSVFSSTLVAKIRNRKNRFLKVLKDSLLMFNLPPINRQAVYDEIYNKKRVVQNMDIRKFLMENNAMLCNAKTLVDNESIVNLQTRNNGSSYRVAENVGQHKAMPCHVSLVNNKLNAKKVDLLDMSLFSLISETNLKGMANKKIPFLSSHSDRLSKVITALKHKSVSGIRIELAGRLTKRNTAARSLFKLRYKGNIKNTDSSDKGLSTVMLRGHAKSNLEFSKNKSKIRIGSYGFKGWVSTS